MSVAAPSEGTGFTAGVVTDTKLLAEVKTQLHAVRAALRASKLQCHDAQEEVVRLRARCLKAETEVARVKQDSDATLQAVAGNVAKVTALQSALVDLVIEFQSNETGGVAATQTYEERKDQILSQCGEDPLVLLDLFRSTLRVQVRVPSLTPFSFPAVLPSGHFDSAVARACLHVHVRVRVRVGVVVWVCASSWRSKKTTKRKWSR